ncbi:50S ribosomal protein L10 [Candidatus Nanobsidianus stetteri]|uniref:50S ribosomal protein L10 n=1 Tax=Nanobsidianus stetteri TaxID=1294122 RepID=A0A2T9WUA8_NANST|nr:50S ribosomal protein L10 [Candidatus Nanobsidianus stetteri]
MVSQQKILYVNDLYSKLSNSKVIGIANIMDIPTNSLQVIRKKLKEMGIDVKVVKKNLFIKTLERINDPNIKKMIDIIEENKRITVLLILPKEEINPFLLNKILEENKSYRSAKEGDILEEDVIIRAGPTNLTPGPVLTELKKYNIKTKVENGKIVITEDALVAKKGQKVDSGLVSLLQKFNITPIPVKIKLLLVYDGKTLYTYDILSTPLEEYINQLRSGFRKAILLAVEISFPTKENIKILLTKAYQNLVKLSLNTGIPTKDTIKELLKIANRRSITLKEKLNIKE